MPPSRCSSTSSSRSEPSSRSRSACFFLNFHQLMSVLLDSRPHHASHSIGCLLPLQLFHHQLPTIGDDGRHSTVDCQGAKGEALVGLGSYIVNASEGGPAGRPGAYLQAVPEGHSHGEGLRPSASDVHGAPDGTCVPAPFNG